MVDPLPRPDRRLDPILLRYSRGEVSAYDAACEIQELGLAGYQDPSASEVVLWSKAVGFGIPSPPEEEARAQADEILRRSGVVPDRASRKEGESMSGRVVAGIIDNIPHSRIGPSPIHGNGLFAERGFARGQILGTLDGQRVRHADDPEVFDQEWNAVSDELLLVRALPTKYRFINHSWKPNCRIDEGDMSIRAVRDIEAGEELTLDYQARPLPPAYLALDRTAFLRQSESSRE